MCQFSAEKSNVRSQRRAHVHRQTAACYVGTWPTSWLASYAVSQKKITTSSIANRRPVVWLSGIVFSALGTRARGRRFDSRVVST